MRADSEMLGHELQSIKLGPQASTVRGPRRNYANGSCGQSQKSFCCRVSDPRETASLEAKESGLRVRGSRCEILGLGTKLKLVHVVSAECQKVVVV